MPIHNVQPSGGSSAAGRRSLHPASMLRSAGLLLQIQIAPPTALAANFAAQGMAIPPSQTGFALVDTGASISGVHEPIAQAMGLQPTGTILLGGAAGLKTHKMIDPTQ